MENTGPLRLGSLRLSLKILVTSFIVFLVLGYGGALVKIYHIYHFSLDEAQLYYRGDEASEGVFIPQTFSSLLSVSHVHLFSQPVMFALIGFLFCFSFLREKTKSVVIATAFLGILMNTLAPWMVRYVSSQCVFLFPLSQVLMMPAFFLMVFVILYEMWRH